jgi:hypothetical protein
VWGGKWRKNPVVEKLAIWFIFSVVVALTPFFLGIFQSIDREQQVTFYSIFGSGQLLLVCVVLAAAALGELVAIDVSDDERITKSAAIGSCILVIILSSLWFGDISADILAKRIPDPGTVSLGSFIFYIWALASSAWCLSLTIAQRRLTGIRQPDDSSARAASGETPEVGNEGEGEG